MAYPFANNQYAQNSSNSHRGYNDPYAQQQPAQFGTSAARIHHEEPGSYDYEPSMVARDAQRDTSSVNNYNSYSGRPEMDRDEKMLNEGTTPYEQSPYGTGISPYVGKSIWTADDKRVMGKRSVPAKLFRTLFCLVINAIIVIISIVSLVVIFARPPNVGIGKIVPPDQNSVGISGSAITLNGSVEFVVSNPNSISASLSQLKANIYDKVDTSQAVGTGSVSDQTIAAHTNTTINFPFQVKYDPTKDTSKTILKDLASKCGLTGGSAGDLDLSLKVDAKIGILSVPIPISFSQDISFTCPLSSDVLKSLGADSISGLLGDSSRRGLQYSPTRQEL